MRGLLVLIPVLLLAQTPAPTTKSTTAAKSTAAAKSTTAAKSTSAPAAGAMTDDQKTIYALGLSIYKNITPFNLSPAELELVK